MNKDKHPLDEIVFGVLPIVNYRGCFVTKQPNSLYSLWGHINLLPNEVDEYIDKSLMVIGNSIKQ
mgnify:CR=1 FL=1